MLIGVASGVAQLVTFVDWAMVKKKGKKQKQRLNHTFKTLEKLEVNLKQIRTFVEENKAVIPSEVKKYVDLLSDAKSELVKDLFDIGIEVDEEKTPKVKETSHEELLATLKFCEGEIIRAKVAGFGDVLAFVKVRRSLALLSKRKILVITLILWGLFFCSAMIVSVFPAAVYTMIISLLLAMCFTLFSVIILMRPW